jgi:hypothetical protein
VLPPIFIFETPKIMSDRWKKLVDEHRENIKPIYKIEEANEEKMEIDEELIVS